MTSLDPFISRDDLSNLLGRDVSEDEGALIAIDASCDMVRSLTAQDFNRGTSAITLDGTGGDALVLPQFPALTVGTVMVNAGTVTDYKLNAVDGVLVRISGTVPAWEYEANYPLFAPYGVPTVVWPKGRQNVEVTYDHGYDEALLPRDIRLVALTIAARIVGQGLALEEQVGTTKVTYAAASTDVTNGEKMILQKYRRSR